MACRKFAFKQISDVLAFVDTGKPAQYMAEVLTRMYSKSVQLCPETLLHHVVLHYKVRHFENHSLLLNEWWKNKLEESNHFTSYQPNFNF